MSETDTTGREQSPLEAARLNKELATATITAQLERLQTLGAARAYLEGITIGSFHNREIVESVLDECIDRWCEKHEVPRATLDDALLSVANRISELMGLNYGPSVTAEGIRKLVAKKAFEHIVNSGGAAVSGGLRGACDRQVALAASRHGWTTEEAEVFRSDLESLFGEEALDRATEDGKPVVVSLESSAQMQTLLAEGYVPAFNCQDVRFEFRPGFPVCVTVQVREDATVVYTLPLHVAKRALAGLETALRKAEAPEPPDE